MENKKFYLLGILASIVFLVLLFLDTKEEKRESPETVKIALRNVGHQLLLTNQDSTSLVLPVTDLEESRYRLSFEKNLSFDPSDLVSIVKETFQKAELPEQYQVEVLRCVDKEIPYSYLIQNEIHQDIIPCGGRFLPNRCYIIEVHFTEMASNFFSKNKIIYTILFLLFLSFLVALYKRKRSQTNTENNTQFISVGSFRFYPEQHTLIKQAIKISLSKKECELLAIFVAQPNQVVKREELIKKVWEDNGVIVGRSLDTYISKLRKKLKDDETIKLINVHGIGYKLEINS